MKSIRDANVHEKKVLIRVDFNVPMKDGKIIDSNRIKSALSTIKYLLEKKAKVIIATHLGRPEGKFDKRFSIIPVAQELAKLLNVSVLASDEVTGEAVKNKIDSLSPGQVFVLGNLRFDSREKQNDQDFAKELAGYGDVYVNDAFSVCHRKDASVDAVTNFLPSYSGFLLESEITTLKLFLQNPERPFIVIVGGAKVEDKVATLEKLAQSADKILIGGAVANTFLKAKNIDVSQSLVSEEMTFKCKEILDKFNEKIILPNDFEKEILDGGEFKIFDIGPKTRDEFVHEISYAKTIFWNGNLGYTEDERFSLGTKMIAEAISSGENNSLVAGGDTAGFVNDNNLAKGFSFISTGGGATMSFLAGEEMPGIEALNKI